METTTISPPSETAPAAASAPPAAESAPASAPAATAAAPSTAPPPPAGSPAAAAAPPPTTVEGVDIKRVISGSTSEVALADLSKKGFKQVKVLNQATIIKLIGQAVDQVMK